jgi:diguanylate cyclase (GGDEF)-like protein
MFTRFTKILWTSELTPAFTLFILTIAFMATLLIGYIRYLTGPEYALSALFLFPIVFISWVTGFKAGVFISLSSALSWLIADLAMIKHFSQWFVPYVNELLRVIVFLFISFLIARLKQIILLQTELATTDPLTRIANRLAFIKFAEHELNKARRFGYPVSIIYFDLDNFKSINDRYGHSEGDKLLKYVAKTVQENIRVIDIVARFGGDEFGLLLPGTESSAAYAVGVKVMRKLNQVMKQNKWDVGISTGLVTYEKIPNHIEEMIRQADGLMYTAKKRGTNIIVHQIVKEKVTKNPFYHL